MMCPRSDLDWLRVAPGKGHAGRGVGWDHDLDLNLPRLDRPCRFGQTIGRDVSCASVCETIAWARPDVQVAIPRLGRREAAHRAVQPVGNGSQGIVVERGHLAGIDRSVRAQAVPALPDGSGPHRHWIEPRWAIALCKQAVGGLILPDAAQGIADQRRPYEAGADMVPTLAHERGQPFACVPTLLGTTEQAKLQGQYVRGLRVDSHASGRRYGSDVDA